MFDYIQKTFYQGMQLVVPLFLAVFIIQKIFEVLVVFLKPVIELLPASPYFGYEFFDLRALIVFLLSIFICGILMRIGAGKYILNIINSFVMKIIPGHSVFEDMIKGESESPGKKYNTVVVANLGNIWSMGVIIEEKNEDGFIIVYIPSAPIPSGGGLFLLKEEMIKRVDLSVQDALKFIWHLGKDSDKILKGKVKW